MSNSVTIFVTFDGQGDKYKTSRECCTVDFPQVNELLERGEDANQCETDGHTPLIAVCQTSKCEAEDRKMIVRLLLMQSSNPLQLDVATNKGLTPLKVTSTRLSNYCIMLCNGLLLQYFVDLKLYVHMCE